MLSRSQRQALGTRIREDMLLARRKRATRRPLQLRRLLTEKQQEATGEC